MGAGRCPGTPDGQGSLDFLPSMPAQPRKLGTTVEAVIYCELPVATTLHRAVAAALDWSLVLIGYGVFLLAFQMMGGEFILTKANLSIFGAAFLLIGFTYGLFFALAGTETPGMHWTQLRLTTFDGFPPEKKHRFIRFGGRLAGLGGAARIWIGRVSAVNWNGSNHWRLVRVFG